MPVDDLQIAREARWAQPPGALMLQTSIDRATSGALIAAVAAKRVRVWRLFLVAATAVTVRFDDGVSGDTFGGGTAFTGAMSIAATGSIVLDALPLPFFDGRAPIWEPWFVTTAGSGLYVTLGSGVQISGRIYYSQSV